MKNKICLLIVLLSSCKQHKEPLSYFNPDIPEKVKANGYILPSDSTMPPTVEAVGKVKNIPAGKPKVIPIISNIYSAGKPEIKIAGIPLITTPGDGNKKLPQINPSIDHPFIAGVPELVVVKDASIKDNDPDNFSSFKSLQGLRQPIIRSIIQDVKGNIWFGTYSGGVSKYDGRFFTNYTIAQGLSNDGVWTMLEDRNKNIWMGTYGGGAIKFDGTNFTCYKTTEGLCNNNVFCLFEDDKGIIWLGTKEGLSCYNGKTFTNFTTEQGLPDNRIHCVTQDKKGNIWIGTHNGACMYNGKSFSIYTKEQGLCDNIVNTIYPENETTIWFGTEKGLTGYDGTSFISYSTKEGLSSNSVYAIYKDKERNLWIATYGGGINKFSGNQFTHFTTHQGLSNDKVTSILEDRSGILWFGTNGGGACRYDGNLFKHLTTSQGLAYNEVMRTVEDKNGNLWFGTWGGGVSKYDGKTFENFNADQGLKNNNVFSMILDSHSNIWFGTGSGVSKYDGKSFSNYDALQGLSNDQVWSIFEDKDHAIWFGTFGDGAIKYDGKYFTHYNAKQGLSNAIVMCILQDKSGNLWFGTYGDGLFKYNGELFTHYTSSGGLSSNEVMDMLFDKEGNLWIGTIGGGVNKYDGKTFTHYSTAQGLSNEIIMGIIQDKKDNLWFSTRNGLNRMINPESNSNSEATSGKPLFKNYLFEDGFLGVNGYVNSIFEDSKGVIWIGTGDRLTCYNPEGEVPDTIPPNIQLSNVSLFNENINWLELQKKKDTAIVLSNGVKVDNFKFDNIFKWYNVPQQLSLSYNNNYLTFQYIGITTKSPNNVKYRYRLEGIDENWNALTDRTEAPYGNLPDGTYTFKVKAMNSEGFWSNEINYTFTIRPPWWKTWWFRFVIVIGVVATIYLIYRMRLNQILRLQSIRNKIASDLHDDIGSTLSSINIFTELAKKQSKEESPLLNQIGEHSHKMLDSMADIVWSINPDNDSFEKIILRMRSFAYDLLGAKNIEFEFNVDETTGKIRLPMTVRKNLYLIFKEAANNMAKYSEASRALFSLSYSEKQLKFLIRDNGKGFDINSLTQGNGLRNMQRRAKEIGAKLTIESDQGTGTNIELLFKI